MQLACIGGHISLIGVPTIAIGTTPIASSMAKPMRVKYIIMGSQNFERKLK